MIALKHLFFAITLLFSSVCAQVNENCDKILNSMSEGCQSIYRSFINASSSVKIDQKEICCAQWRYNVCFQSVVAYSTIAKLTQICPELIYEKKILKLAENRVNSAMKCEKSFNPQSCLSGTVDNALKRVKSNVSPLNFSLDHIANHIDHNLRQGFSSLHTFAQNIQNSIIKSSTDNFAAMKTDVHETKKLSQEKKTDKSTNRYSTFQNDKAIPASIDVINVRQSFIPEVDYLSNEPASNVNVDRSIGSLFDWFNGPTSNSNSKLNLRHTNITKKNDNGNLNPYS